MPSEATKRSEQLQQRKREIDFIKSGKWPHMVLPVESRKVNPATGRTDLGYIVDERRPVVTIGNIFGAPKSGREGEQMTYPSFDKLLDEWKID